MQVLCNVVEEGLFHSASDWLRELTPWEKEPRVAGTCLVLIRNTASQDLVTIELGVGTLRFFLLW